MSHMRFSIGTAVRRNRRRRGLSQGALAKKARLSLNTVVKLELGVNDNPTVKTVDALARALGVRFFDLLN